MPEDKRFARGDKRKYVVNPETGCWEWVGARNQYGYGSVKAPGARWATMAHRYIWELELGRPVKKGLELDHLCGVRACVNPLHLEEVDSAMNRPGVIWDVWYLSKEEEGRLEELWDAGKSIRTICEEMYCSRPTIVLGLRRAGLVRVGQPLRRR